MALEQMRTIKIETNDPDAFTNKFKSKANNIQTKFNPYISKPARMVITIPDQVSSENKIHVHIGPNDTDLYDSREWRSYFENRYGKANIESTTVATEQDRMIHMAGKRHPVTGVPYDLKGFPIFDDYSLVDLHIPSAIVSIKGADSQHYKEATVALKGMINSGKIDKGRFSQRQLDNIEAEQRKIYGCTWHHHQDFGRMQLVKEYEHGKTGHLGGSKMWFGR